MAGIKAFLSAREKAELIDFIAATGENYERYLDYCARRGWTAFTQKYLHTWLQRRRAKLQLAREKHKEEVRRISMFDKQRRIEELEASVQIINSHIVMQTVEDHNCSRCGLAHSVLSPDMVIKLMEQKRKTLEAIAKERNEWLKEVSSGREDSTRDRLREAVTKALSQTKEAKVFDGAVLMASSSEIV